MSVINLPCLGYREDYGYDGYEYNCGSATLEEFLENIEY